MTTESCPCPKCGDYRLVYDGMLAWRRGEPRPSRNSSSKGGKPPSLGRLQGQQAWLSSSVRADDERSSLYHCDSCRAEFFHDMGQRSLHLYEEGVSGKYVYDESTGQWQTVPGVSCTRGESRLPYPAPELECSLGLFWR